MIAAFHGTGAGNQGKWQSIAKGHRANGYDGMGLVLCHGKKPRRFNAVKQEP